MKLLWDLIMRLSYSLSKRTYGIIIPTEPFDWAVLNRIDFKREIIRVYRPFKYKYDKLRGIINHIPSPDQAARSNTGDCDDFAAKIIQKGGEGFYMVTYFPKAFWKAHTVAVGIYEDTKICYNWSRAVEFDSEEEMLNYFSNYSRSLVKYAFYAKWDEPKRKWIPIKYKDMK